MIEPRPGMLLVASPELLDPNFAEAVVLLLDSDEDGALGVVLNHPSPVLVADVLDQWRDVVSDPDVVFRGGPVSPDGALGLARPADPAAPPVGYREVIGGMGMGVVDLDTPVELLEGGLAALRIFVGYAGWGPGQLDAEVAEGSWYVVPGVPADAFADDPDDLRRDVLRRQPGELAWAVNRPVDPTLN
ncbi:YqgE/AlgH family protein [Nocardioides sp. CPCC 205120]|uniref:YqgE/AlgH family protein n=1 Tax=Nocardioides sp. CPCC 205120 TaxID=3406462 RepID=UPI003B50FE21